MLHVTETFIEGDGTHIKFQRNMCEKREKTCMSVQIRPVNRLWFPDNSVHMQINQCIIDYFLKYSADAL